MPASKMWVMPSRGGRLRPVVYGRRTGGRLRKQKYGLMGRKIRNKWKYNVGTDAYFFTSGQPTRKSVALRYAETVTLTTGALGIFGTTQTYLLSSMFDVNLSGGGHQHYLRDTYAALYNKYRINAQKITIIWNTIGGTAEICGAACISSSTGFLSLTGLNIDRATEIPNVSTIAVSGSGNNRVCKQEFYIKNYQIEGLTKKQYNSDPNTQSVMSDSPVLSQSLQVNAASYSGVGSETVQCQILLTTYVTFFGRLPQSQS